MTGCIVPNIALAVILNFGATIVQGTCSLSLDKSILPLGNVFQPDLKKGLLLNAQPVKLLISKCSGIEGLTQQATVTVKGSGMTSGGKWLFRSNGSAASGAGIMLIQQDTQPSASDTAVKSGDIFPLTAKGVIPGDTVLPFYAGVSCGGPAECANVGTGELTAHIVFSFAFR